MDWYKSSSKTTIPQPPILNPFVSDLFFHKNLVDSSQQVWLCTESAWVEITSDYFSNSGVKHPALDRYLEICEGDGEPTFIVKDTFKKHWRRMLIGAQ